VTTHATGAAYVSDGAPARWAPSHCTPRPRDQVIYHLSYPQASYPQTESEASATACDEAE